MQKEPVVTVRRPAVLARLGPLSRGSCQDPPALPGRGSRLVRRVADRLYDLVDLRTRERYEHRRLPF